MKKQYFIGLFLFLLSMTALAKEQTHGFQVTWPKAWEVTTPLQKNGSYLVVAKKVVEGVPKAAISLHEVPRKDKEKVDLKHEFEKMLKTSEIAFLHSGYKVAKTDISPISFKGKDGFTSTLLLSHPAQTLTQKLTMILTDNYRYTFAVIKVGDSLSSETLEEIKSTIENVKLL